MPASFFFLDPGVQLWTPQAFTDEQRQEYHSNSWSMIARLAPGATIAQAQAAAAIKLPRAAPRVLML